MAAWNEEENRETIRLYLDLLLAEVRGENPVKAEIYRSLHGLHPTRSPKAFERKFQNISAILYEQRLPYCSGLKPSFNYQRLLKLQLLDALDRTPIPPVEPREILRRRLKELKEKEVLPITTRGTGKFGLALETALGINQNSSKLPDFMGIELKTKSDDTLQTLFSRTPSRYVGVKDRTELFERYGYAGRGDRERLSTSFSSVEDKLGFSIWSDSQTIKVLNGKQNLMEYDAERIEEALLSKHSQAVYLKINQVEKGCQIDSALYCQWPSVIRFLRMVNSGQVNLDFTLSRKNKSVRDHGFLWRVQERDLVKLYLKSESMDLN
jgi:hypothetical protein